MNSSSWPRKRLEVLDRLDVDQRSRQEGAQTDVDGQASFDAVDHATGNDRAVLVGCLDILPDAHTFGLGLREQDVALHVLGLLEKNLDLLTDLNMDFARCVDELLERNQPFGLVADVDDHLARGDLDHRSLDDLALFKMAHAVVVESD